MSAPKIKIVIIDDEPLARKRIEQLLAKEPDAEIVAECANGVEAIAAINERRPDLIFLDVQMPEVSGFDVLHQLDAAVLPAVIFVTAFEHFTIQAFDLSAVDYLLKPFAEERFRQAFARARSSFRAGEHIRSAERLSRLFERLNYNGKFLERLAVAHNNRLILVQIKDVEWIETYGNYLKVHAAGKIYLLRETMNHLSARLDPERFLRIHRSTLVNIEAIVELQPTFGGQYAIIVRDGSELTLSRHYRKTFLEKFEL